MATAIKMTCGHWLGDEPCGQPAAIFLDLTGDDIQGISRVYRCFAHGHNLPPRARFHSAGPIAAAETSPVGWREYLTPEVGERVVQVPQSSHYLLTTGGVGLIGRPASDLKLYVTDVYGQPSWINYQPARDPGRGYGLIVVRDGLCYRGPTRWDSGD